MRSPCTFNNIIHSREGPHTGTTQGDGRRGRTAGDEPTGCTELALFLIFNQYFKLSYPHQELSPTTALHSPTFLYFAHPRSNWPQPLPTISPLPSASLGVARRRNCNRCGRGGVVSCFKLLEGELRQQLGGLTLLQLLEREGLTFEERLAVPKLVDKVQREMGLFIRYCRTHHQFTLKLIRLGLHRPLPTAPTPLQTQIAAIAVHVLGGDHQALGDLLIGGDKENESDWDIVEEVETEDSLGGETEIQGDKYRLLSGLMEYLMRPDEELDENCLNYVVNALNTLVRKKLSDFLQYLTLRDQYLPRLALLSHYPAVSHLLAKLLTDDQDNLSPSAIAAKRMVVPLLTAKIRREAALERTSVVLEGVQAILESSRYCDIEQRSVLQEESDGLVNQVQVQFHLDNVKNSLAEGKGEAVRLSVTYLGLLVGRMNMDEQQDYCDQPNQFHPNLNYQLEVLFESFPQLLQHYSQVRRIEQQNPSWRGISLKLMELMLTMAKHSRFAHFYSSVSRQARVKCLSILIDATVGNLSGIQLQVVSTLTEKLILLQQTQTEDHITCQNMKALVATHLAVLTQWAHTLTEETLNHRNRNQKGIYIRKLLLLITNYRNQQAVTQARDVVGELLPLGQEATRIYAQQTAVNNHPAGIRVRPVHQFAFLARNAPVDNNTHPIREDSKETESERVVFKLEFTMKPSKTALPAATPQPTPTPCLPNPLPPPQPISNGSTEWLVRYLSLF